MFALFHRSSIPILVSTAHVLVLLIVNHFVSHWAWLGHSSPTDSWIAAALLGWLGADLGLLGIWAGLEIGARSVRWPATVVCAVSWCGIYDPSLYWIMHYWPYDASRYEFYCRPAAIAGTATLVISAVAIALCIVGRRGARLKRLAPDELHRESGSRQFKVAHLLLLILVLSLLLGFSVNCRQRFSALISMRWSSAVEAPTYSAETVMLSAVFLVTTTLTVAWAALGDGRPSLRLTTAWATAGLLGFAWAFSFTAPRHHQYLFWNGLFSSGVSLLQALLMAGVLLIIRSRGYRLMRGPTI